MTSAAAAAQHRVPRRVRRVLVVGLGNPLRGDDSAGIRVVEHLRRRLRPRPDLVLAIDTCGGLRLMERMVGFDAVLIADAVTTGAPPGTVHTLRAGDLAAYRRSWPHEIDLLTALGVGRAAGFALPPEGRVHVVGIEAAQVDEFRESCTPAVEAAIVPAAARLLRLIARERRA